MLAGVFLGIVYPFLRLRTMYDVSLASFYPILLEVGPLSSLLGNVVFRVLFA